MNRLIYKKLWLTAIFTLAALALNVAQADEDTNPFLIEKALDEPAQISLKNITLEEVFFHLSRKIGIEIDLDRAGPALSQLPYGKLTQIASAHLEGLTWRQALTELLKPFALTFQPGSDCIYILGTKDLMRQPRRLNIAELEAIVLLQNTQLDNKSGNLLQQIRTRTNIKFDLFVHGKKLDRIDREDGRRILNQGPFPAGLTLHQYSQRIYRRGKPSTW